MLEYTGNVDLGGFAVDRMRQQATSYAFATPVEALNLVMKHARSGISDVRMIIDMRNRLIHGYASVDMGIVRATVKVVDLRLGND